MTENAQKRRFELKVSKKSLRDVSALGMEDLRRGIFVGIHHSRGVGKLLDIFSLDRVAPVREICRIKMPQINLEDYDVVLQSVEVTRDGGMIVGVAGTLTSQMRCVAERFVDILKRDNEEKRGKVGMSGFFGPGYHIDLLRVLPSVVYIGPKASHLSALPSEFQHVRSWDSNLGLAFIEAHTVKTISLEDVYAQNWIRKRTVKDMARAALYLDRVKDSSVIVSTETGAFCLDLFTKHIKRVASSEGVSMVSAILSDIHGVSSEDVNISMTGSNQLIIAPSSPKGMTILARC